MNYAGKFDATLSGDGAGTHDSPAYIHIDSPHAQVPKDAIVVPDAHLLFNADFKRSGVDLILSKDDHELVLHDYFKGEKRAPLASPDGAHLTGDLVNALTGAVQYSQAGGAPAAASQVIGHVTKLAGNATAIRNGVSIILHQGDNVEKGDVVQAGADSTLGITFIDGSVFGLASNARMVLNEMVYDPNGSNNSSLISLVAGTISFVAGETAKHGDMKVDTPVATMGIRGTAVLVEIDFTIPQGADHPDAKYQVLVEPDGTTGSYILFDKTTLQPIAVVNQAGQQVNISNGVVSTSASQLSPDLQKLIAEVFTQKFASTDDTHSNTHLTDSINPNLITGQTIKTADGTTATPIFQVTGSTTGSSPGGSTGSNGLQHIDQAPKASAGSETVTEVLKTTGSNTLDLAFNKVSFDDINVGDQPTVSTSFDHFTYTDANGKAVPNLNALQTADIKATEVDLVVVQDPANGHVGAATWTYLIPDHAFDFLAAGEKLTLTYTALVDSNYAPNDLKTPVQFTITITGTNDVPVITSDQQTQLIQFAAGTSTQGGPLQVFNGEQTSGTFAFTDPDLTDTHQITDTHGAPSNIAILTSASLVIDGQTLDLAALEARYPTPMTAFEQALSVAVGSDSTGTGNGTISWKLADLPVYLADFIPKDQKLTLTYTITLMDSQGATDTKTVEVTIGGTDNAAEVWIHTVGDGNDNLWTTGKNWETGNVPVATDDVIIVTNQLHPITDPSQPNAPVYPATITAGTNAVANSVTMNDFTFPQSPGDPPPLPPVLEVQAADAQHSAGSLSIGTTLAMSADSVLNNAGTVNVGTQIELLDGSVPNKSQITNSGTLNLDTSKVAQAGDIQGNASITNTGTIDLKGGTLNVLVGVANVQGDSAGQIIVDAGATLVLGTDPKNGPGVVGGITGGTVTINGTLELQGTSFLKNGIFVNDNQVNVTGTGTALENEKVTNDGNIDISGALLVDPTTIDNTKGTIQVDGSGGTLTLNDATITGGTVTNNGTLDLTGTALLKNGTLGNFGQINVSSSGNALGGETVTANHALEILAGGALTIDHGSTVANSSGTITIDAAGNGLAAATLNLNDATITGGTVTDNGLIDVIGDSKIDGNATLNNGAVTVESGIKLTLDNVTVTGTTFTNVSPTGSIIQIDDGTRLTLSGATIDGGTINDGTAGGTGVPPVIGSIDVTGDSTISNASLNNGKVTIEQGISLTLDNDTVTGAFIEVDGSTGIGNLVLQNGTTVDASQLKIDGSDELTLDGAIITGGTLTVGTHGLVQTVGSGATFSGTTVWNDGTIEIKDGTLLKVTGSIVGSGSVQIDSDALFELNGSDTQNVVFAGASAEMQIDGASFGGNIVGLAATDELDLRSIGYGPSTTGTYVSNSNNDGGTLTITDGAHSISMTLVGDYRNAHFAGSTDGNKGTLITLNAADDAPAFVSGETAQTGVLAELPNTTGSSVLDPLPPLSGSIHFTDIDLTDRPTATITAQSVTWLAADHATDLSLSQPERDALGQALSLIQSGNTNNGAIGWTYSIGDSALDFLAAGETAKVVSTVTLDDHEGRTDTATVTITVTGTNDAPVLAVDTSGADGSGLHAITERANTTGDNIDLDTASGTLAFTDVDLTDTHTVSQAAPAFAWSGGALTTAQMNALAAAGTLALTDTDSTHSGTGSVGFSYSAADDTFDFLAAGQTLTITYELTVTDNNNASSTQPVTITITGTNDAPVITSSAQSGSITELMGQTGSIAADTASGAVTFTDADLSDTHTVTLTGVTTSGATSGLPSNSTLLHWLSFGALTDSTNGATGSDAWTFSAQDKNFDYLGAGQTVMLTYTVQVADHHGGVTSQNVVVTITGTNDAPVIVSETDPSTQTVILAKTPIVLAQGVDTNSLGLHTETFDSRPAGSASNNGLGHGNFFNSDLGATFTASGDAGVVHGSSNVTAAPFMGLSPGHADTTNYLSIGANGTETITFTAEQNAFGLYWGSIDSYNTIDFYNGTKHIASYTGADVSPLLASGNQGSFASNGYVEFLDLAPFNKVVFGASANAFEIDNVSAGFISDSHIQLASPITGTLTISDADIGDTLTASVIGDAVVKYDGSTTLPSDANVGALIDPNAVTFDSVTTNGGLDVLHWTYNPTNPDLDFLEPGDTLTVTFEAQVNDGHATTSEQPLTLTIVGTGASVVNGTAQNDTFVDVGGGVTIFGRGGQDTFEFKPNFGSATIGDFDVTKDTIDLDKALFASVQSVLASAEPANFGHDTVITDALHDKITLTNVTVAQLNAHPNDFHLV